MKKLIIFLGMIAFFSGCSIRSYNKTISCGGEKTQKSYNAISNKGVWCGFRGCDYNYVSTYANGCNCEDVFCDCDCSDGMCIEDDLGW